MVRVFACVFEEHNLWLVGVAGVLCMLCWAGALLVLERVESAPRNWRRLWLFLSGVAAGGGAWATHLVGMLAYEPGLPVAFELRATLLSAAIGVLGAWAAFELFHRLRGRAAPILGGVALAAAVTAVHYVSMSGVGAAARMSWDWGLIIASGALAAGFAIAGLIVLQRAQTMGARVLAGALLVGSIFSLHFTGMGALTLTPDPTLPTPEGALDRTGLTVIVAIGAAALMSAAATFSFADRRVAAAKFAAAARMNRLADAALEGLVIHDGERLLDANATFATMVGCEVDELVGRSFASFVAPDSRDLVEAAARGQRGYPIEATLVGSKGLLEVEIFRRALNPDESLYVSAVRDISVRRRAERAEQSNTAKSQYLASMSHELRTPLNAIIGFSELLIEESGERATVEDAGRIRSAAKNLLTLLNELLDISKIEAGRMEMAIEDCVTRSIVADVCDTMTPQIEAKGLSLVINVAENVPQTRADAFRLKQCLLNLLSNAVKFTETGSITVSARAHGEQVQLIVADTGIGMAPAQQVRLFGDYMQVDAATARRFGGAGLGLAIAKRLVTLMNGDITVQSQQGKGSMFTITLPAAPRAAKRLNVLIIDDDRDAAELLHRSFAALGARTRVAHTAAAGLELAFTSPFDLIVLDIHLPDMSGWEVLTEIRRANGPPVLVHTVEDARKKALTMEAAAYFMKPAPRDALTAAAMRLMRGQSEPTAPQAKRSLAS